MLGSGSPRRRELLEGLGFEPVVRVASVDERRARAETPAQYTRRLSSEKGNAVRDAFRGQLPPDSSPWILSADTIVVLDGDVLEKPADPVEAVEMLTRLSDQWHTVVTSFTVLGIESGVERTVTVEAGVRFRALSADEIRRYVASGEPLDKAGSYGIQRLGGFLVREIRGSYFAVVGLPVCEVVETLLEVGAVERFPFDREAE